MSAHRIQRSFIRKTSTHLSFDHLYLLHLRKLALPKMSNMKLD